MLDMSGIFARRASERFNGHRCFVINWEYYEFIWLCVTESLYVDKVSYLVLPDFSEQTLFCILYYR